MALETEAKLTVRKSDVADVHHWLVERNAHAEGAANLENIYFDTPDLVLNRQKVALRIRRKGQRYLQTLKTQGDASGGVHRRNEWEWPVDGPALDRRLLRETPLDLDEPQWQALNPIFATNFQRETWAITTTEGEVECALDQGLIEAHGRERPLCEVELELRQGDESILLTLARELAARIPVLANSISKAEQGYFLAGHYRPGFIMPDEADPPLDGWSLALSRYWLTGERDHLLLAWGWLNQLRESASRRGHFDDWRRLTALFGAHLLEGADSGPLNVLDEAAVGRLQHALVGA